MQGITLLDVEVMRGLGYARGEMTFPRATDLLKVLASAVFVLQFVALDLVTRSGDLASRDPGHAFLVRAASVCLWAGVAFLARTRTLRIAAALVASVVLVVQALVFRYYHTPLDVQVAATAVHAFQDVRPVLVRALPGALAVGALTFACELGVLSLAHARAGAARAHGLVSALQRRRSPIAVVLFVVAFVIAGLGSPRDATPEIAAAHALSAVFRVQPSVTVGAVSLPPLLGTRSELPDVLVVLSESVRARDYVPGGPLATASEAAALTPGRVDLAEMRAVSSYTAVSLSALLTGRSQEGSRDELLRSANLFDVARAARSTSDERYSVLYVSAQSETVFEAKDVRASVDTFVTVESMLGRDIDDAEIVTLPLDANATSELERALHAASRPVFAVLHLAGTHAPYFVDETTAPFRPFSHVVTWSGMPELHNAYRNAIVAQDREVARALRAFADHAGSRPRIVIFTSDHGEAFGEHGAIHHGQNLYDEQIHVPGWIWASPGALTSEQEAALADARSRFTTHLDLAPTLLDVLGLGDNTALREMRAKLSGASLVRPHTPHAPVPVTNCTGMFPCPLDTWGLLADDRKLIAQRWDADWRCFVLGGEERPAPPNDAACAQLREASRTAFATLPNGRLNH